MPRPRCKRIVWGEPDYMLFKPIGVPASQLDEVVMTVDELEALRLADFMGLYHDEAAGQMKVSRQTFGRIIESARKKTARTLIEGKVLRIEGGTVEVTEKRTFMCDRCSHTWEAPHGAGRPEGCPLCTCTNIHRSQDQRDALIKAHACRGPRCRRAAEEK